MGPALHLLHLPIKHTFQCWQSDSPRLVKSPTAISGRAVLTSLRRIHPNTHGACDIGREGEGGSKRESEEEMDGGEFLRVSSADMTRVETSLPEEEEDRGAFYTSQRLT